MSDVKQQILDELKDVGLNGVEGRITAESIINKHLEGMAIVPEIATPEMIKAANNAIHFPNYADERLAEEITYQTMLESFKEQS